MHNIHEGARAAFYARLLQSKKSAIHKGDLNVLSLSKREALPKRNNLSQLSTDMDQLLCREGERVGYHAGGNEVPRTIKNFGVRVAESLYGSIAYSLVTLVMD